MTGTRRCFHARPSRIGLRLLTFNLLVLFLPVAGILYLDVYENRLLEAMYHAAYRWSALIEIYKSEEQLKKSDEAKARAIAVAQKAIAQAGQSDWGPRARRLLYMVQQGILTYGNGQ